MKCGLLGQHLSHSYSPMIHRCFGNEDYLLFQKEEDQLEDFLRNGDFTGLNVTIPYKKAVLPYLDQISPTAKKLGAVNTILRRPDGTLWGHNTDYGGFSAMLERSKLNVSGKKVLILGSGGASATVHAVLEEKGAIPVVISRQGENNYHNLHLHTDASLIVNATPVGMYPHCGHSPIDLSLFPSLKGVLDLIYNPSQTKLLLDAKHRSLVTMNGLWMLVIQARESAELFLGRRISTETAEEVYRQLRRSMENIILIGMPGCGKSTIGSALAQKSGRTFIDIDDEIEKIAQRSCGDIITQDGESAFRQLETQVLERYAIDSHLVIATGGGCVTRAENEDILKQNGRLIWLQRDISRLDTGGRPLSVDLPRLYAQRCPLYHAFADHIVQNDGTVEETISQILEVLS